MTGHGFRIIASTLLNEDGTWRADAIERQLSHQEDDEVRGAYNAAEYLAERRRMMQVLSDPRRGTDIPVPRRSQR
jgi:hypothetical protein